MLTTRVVLKTALEMGLLRRRMGRILGEMGEFNELVRTS